MTMISAGDAVKFWTESRREIYESCDVKCPLCGEFWNKLYAARWKSTEGEKENSVCVSCAESVRSVKFARQFRPLEVPVTGWASSWCRLSEFWPKDLQHDWDIKTFYPGQGMVNEIVVMWKLQRIMITAFKEGRDSIQNDAGAWVHYEPALKWILLSAGEKLALYDSKKWEFMATYRHGFEAWEDIRRRLMEWAVKFTEAQKKIDESWGTENKMPKRRL